MVTRTLSLAAFSLGLLMLAGCGSAPKLEKIGVRVKEISPSGATMTLLFINPNNVPLVVPSTEHALTLDGASMGVIKNTKPLGIPPLGTITESVPLSDAVAKKIARAAAIHPGPSTYVIDSTLNLTWDDDIHAYKTSDRGSVTLAPSPVVAP
ncbi:MAG: hypothetical protein WC661_20015 [Opitutaceae bacterium]|jgi:LEA14-like dessication related protein